MPVKMGALLSSRGRFHGRGISDVGQPRFKAEILPAEKHAVRMTNKGSPLPHVRDDRGLSFRTAKPDRATSLEGRNPGLEVVQNPRRGPSSLRSLGTTDDKLDPPQCIHYTSF